MTDPTLPPQLDTTAFSPAAFCQAPRPGTEYLCGELMIGTLDGWRCPSCGAVVTTQEALDRAAH